MPKKPSSKTLRKKLDTLWRTIGKEGAVCEICETLMPADRVNYSRLDPHHMVRRGHASTRWDLANRLWVCPSHHTLGKQTVQHNEEGWFWSKDSNNDWLGLCKPGLKEYLSKKKVEIKKWKPYELQELYENLRKLT